MSKDPLLQPFQLKHLTLKNRLMMSSHEPSYTEDGMPKDRYRLYHLERAKGGLAMTMTAGSAVVSRDSPPVFGNILAYTDEVVPWMRKLADDCHEHGCAVMIQLTHLGRRSVWDGGDWLPSVAPGPFRETAHRAFPKVAEDWDIERIITDFADATERMQAAGLDGVEIECYGHLLDQFLSPLTNTQPAPWGGDFSNRMRFATEVLAACRKRAGPKFIIGMRFVADEDEPGGTTLEEGVAFARHLKDADLIDFINVIRGRIHTDAALADVIPVQGMRSAPHLDFAGRVRTEVGLPTFHASKIADVATARHAVATGQLDMVGMTRAHIADPHIVEKLSEGREDEIRPCVGATYCLGRIYYGKAALCIHNPATGREETMPHKIARADTPRRVTVVGAGPAGLEAARVAAERGHNVTVFEAADQPGGQVRLSAQTTLRTDMIGIIDWRMAQCQAMGVTFHFNTFADASDVTGTDPDVVIIATGGLPNTETLEAGNDLAVTPWDILSGDVKPGEQVLIHDETGDYAALQAAEKLTDAGAEVEIVTPYSGASTDVSGITLVPFMRKLQARDVRFTVTWRVTEVHREGNRLRAVLGSDYARDERRARLVDQVVVNHGTLPLDDLYFELKPASSNLGAMDYDDLIAGRPQTTRGGPDGFQLFRIGDAVSSRNTHAAIFDALRLVKDL
ncbi:NADH:flavin oxidoreductase [Roseovarius aestuariivivens]|uniref:NADH:flavin oxidoreductase n=1 Tax=Roseovarius aestuariivivens TaxID=1888910 RepID=UPI001080C323|nr:NADH:flavin oxidoreductase [Roseovarius aestuariivivens]